MKITSIIRMTAPKRDGSSLKDLVVQQISRIIQVVKYILCPPSLVSRVLLSWQLVDPYLYESSVKQPVLRSLINADFYM